jgi:hypothetical protein
VRQDWSAFNNVGLCAAAIANIVEHCGSLSVSKALLIMPLIMHDATLTFLSKGNIRRREVAALVSVKPELFANFNDRFENSLVLSLNSIQLLAHLGYVRIQGDVLPVKPILIGPDFGRRAERIVREGLHNTRHGVS